MECIDETDYDARASTCGPDGEIIETEEQYSCSGSTPYCMQCGPRGIGAALCLSSPDLGDRDCGTTTTSPPVACTADWRPVCGSDGVIYRYVRQIDAIVLRLFLSELTSSSLSASATLATPRRRGPK